MQIIEATDRDKFNNFLVTQRASVLQSWQWGDFQKKLGRRVRRLLLTSNTGKILAAASIIRMSLPRGLSYLYCPHGPVIMASPHTEKIWQLILDKLSDLVIVERPIFFRVDPALPVPVDDFHLHRFGFQKLGWEIQPKDTVILDLRGTESDLLHRMKPKTRYNINLAVRKGVEVERVADSRKMRVFWSLMKETTKRDEFSAHPYSYYLSLMDTMGRQGMAEMFVASYKFRPLAAAIVLYFGAGAWYLHGASSDQMRSTMAPHLVQWSAIKSAKTRGATTYDFHGVAPNNVVNHPWAGVTRFKKGFGGSEVSYIGAYDLAYRPGWYRMYRVARWLNSRV